MYHAKDYLFKTYKDAQNRLFGYYYANPETMHNIKQQQQSKSDTAIQVSQEYKVLERYLIWFQKILFWHEPSKSAIVLSSILSSFYLFIGLFIYNFAKIWLLHIWPEISMPHTDDNETTAWIQRNPQYQSISSINSHYKLAKEKLMKISTILIQQRAENPLKFCFRVCVFFLITAAIGRLVDGLALFFVTLCTSLVAPGIYVHYGKTLKTKANHHIDACEDYLVNIFIKLQSIESKVYSSITTYKPSTSLIEDPKISNETVTFQDNSDLKSTPQNLQIDEWATDPDDDFVIL